MNKLEKIEMLRELGDISSILIIDENFINKTIEKIESVEYSVEQLDYLVSLDESLFDKLLEKEFEYSIKNLTIFVNIQKLIKEKKEENDLAEFQKNILEQSDTELLTAFIEKLIPLHKQENRKIIRNCLQELYNDENSSKLLLEKIDSFCNNQRYRKIKRIIN